MLDPQRLLDWPFEPVIQNYTERDTMLYALGISFGTDPVDPEQLRFVYEKNLCACPTMVVVLGHPGPWIGDPRTGINRKMVVHGEQGVFIERPLAPAGRIRAQTRVTQVIDKGPGKGALVYTERQLFDDITGDRIARLSSTSFCRADGGFGGQAGPVPQPHPIPERAPDEVIRLPTLAQSALLYRLNADYNPLHADPELARLAGYARPILHGLCTYGVASHAVLKTACGYRPERLRSFEARFSSPVFPGETLETRLWHSGKEIAFETWVTERNTKVLANGLATLA
jgi:acyl dehydratase